MTRSTKVLITALLSLAAVSFVRAQDASDLDNYKLRVDGNWWFSHPSGYFGARNGNNYFDVNRDFGFGSHSTFTGGFDYHFRHKHHLLLTITPDYNSKTATLSRTIEFDGQTFPINAQVTANVNTLNIAPGYQYDIIRRDHGFLGLEVDFNIIRTTGQLSANINGLAKSVSDTVWVPIPSVGPSFRWYPLHDSTRLAIDGAARGIPFFGYGNFITARGSVDVGLTKHLMIRGGYQMGSRLSIHGTSDQIALQLVHRGPTAGIEYSFGESPEKKPKVVSTEPGDWHVDWIPAYLWFSGLKGSVGAGGYVAPVDVSFSDVFKRLNIGYMSVLDVRRKRVGLLTDLIFMSLSSDQQTTPFDTFSGFTANAKELIVDPELYVRVVDSDRGYVDAVGGGRFWHLNNSLDLFPTNPSISPVTVGQTQNWVDPVLGARMRLNLTKKLFADLKGDAGGFGVGSQLTYQIYAGMGVEFKERYSLLAGYRYLSVDYQSGGFLYDVHMNGMLLGFGLRFK